MSRGVLPTVVCDLETSRMRRPWPAGVRRATGGWGGGGGEIILVGSR